MNKNNQYANYNMSWILRLEGLMVFVSSLLFYNYTNTGSWKVFFCLFLFPDLGLLGYLGGKKLGALTYNILHTYITPLSLGIFFYTMSFTEQYYIVVIWVAHIGFDRALGFGLKYAAGFKYTHLGIISRS